MIISISTTRKLTAKFLAAGLFVLFTFYISLATANADLFGLPVAQIVVQGNTKTQTRFVLEWAKISVGDFIDQSKLDLARQNILDTELFKQVTLQLEMRQSKPSLIIKLEERFYTLLLPRLSRNADGDVRLGINLTMHNINGANQTLNLLAEKSELSNGDDGRRNRIVYDFPLYNRPYRHHISLSDSVTNTLSNNFRNIIYENFALFSVTRDWHVVALAYPLSITTSFTYQKIHLRSPYPDAMGELDAGNFNRVGLKIENDAIHTQQYRRYGYFYSLEILQGLKSLGSDYSSRTIKVESRFYLPLNQQDNFNTRLVFGLSKNSPFNVAYYELGGSDTFRGLEKGSSSGDALLLVNLEYVKGLENYPSFRWSSFIDVGNVYQDFGEIDLGKLKTSIGFGGRWKALSFVKTDIFIDYAYNIDTDNNKLYAGTSLTF
jgi:outer membrane protein assembly factor BamA